MRSCAQPAQDRGRGPRWTLRAAVLCPALGVLLAALVVCLGYAEHGGSGKNAAAPTAVSAVTAAAAGIPAGHHVPPVAQQGDCPSGDTCCSPAAHDAAGVLGAPTPSLPVALPRVPGFPSPEQGPTVLAQPPPVHGAPDLHVLQVQRT